MWDQFVTSGEGQVAHVNGLTLLCLTATRAWGGTQQRPGWAFRSSAQETTSWWRIAPLRRTCSIFCVVKCTRPFRKPPWFSRLKLLRYPKPSQRWRLQHGRIPRGHQRPQRPEKSRRWSSVLQGLLRLAREIRRPCAEKPRRGSRGAASSFPRRGSQMFWQATPKCQSGVLKKSRATWGLDLRERTNASSRPGASPVPRTQRERKPSFGVSAVHQQRHDALLGEVVAMAKFDLNPKNQRHDHADSRNESSQPGRPPKWNRHGLVSDGDYVEKIKPLPKWTRTRPLWALEAAGVITLKAEEGDGSRGGCVLPD